MTADNDKDWTAFRVWTHPKSALYDLDELDIMNNDLNRRLEETAKTLEESRRRNEGLLAELAAEKERNRGLLVEKNVLETRLADSDASLDSAQSELADLREELSDQEEVDRKIEEFSRRLEKFEQLKMNYERRIAELEARLRDAVNNTPGLQTRSDDSIPERRRRQSPPSDDWLQFLPDDI